jgi:cytochrome P450
MRALLGLDPSADGLGHDAAILFERALSFYDTETWKMLLRGPGTPWARLQSERRALDRIILAEIERRRGESLGERDDVLSMLIGARDETNDEGFTPLELRDQVMHLLFGGHDTTSSTLSFLLYELARNPAVHRRVTAELDAVLDGRPPTAEDLINGLPYLSMVVDETLRLYPPVWFGPRLTVRPFTFAEHRIPAGVHVIHSSWVTHRLPEVFPDPETFNPERFGPEHRRRLPPGAYIPFGGGQRICIGKRFGQLAVKAIAATVLARHRLELTPGFELRIAKLPTLSPEHGLPMRVVGRQPAAARDTVSS